MGLLGRVLRYSESYWTLYLPILVNKRSAELLGRPLNISWTWISSSILHDKLADLHVQLTAVPSMSHIDSITQFLNVISQGYYIHAPGHYFSHLPDCPGDIYGLRNTCEQSANSVLFLTHHRIRHGNLVGISPQLLSPLWLHTLGSPFAQPHGGQRHSS